MLVKVPPGGRCIELRSRDVVFEDGTEFIAQIERCHLSDGLNDWPAFEAIDSAEPAMYLSRQFRIHCKILARLESGASSASLPRLLDLPRATWPPTMAVPARWMTHALRDNGGSTKLEAVPVPDWLSG